MDEEKKTTTGKPIKRTTAMLSVVIAIMGIVIGVLILSQFKLDLLYLLLIGGVGIGIIVVKSRKTIGFERVGGHTMIQDIKNKCYDRYGLNPMDTPWNMDFRMVGEMFYVFFMQENLLIEYDPQIKDVVAHSHVNIKQKMKEIETSDILKGSTIEEKKRMVDERLKEELGYM